MFLFPHKLAPCWGEYQRLDPCRVVSFRLVAVFRVGSRTTAAAGIPGYTVGDTG